MERATPELWIAKPQCMVNMVLKKNIIVSLTLVLRHEGFQAAYCHDSIILKNFMLYSVAFYFAEPIPLPLQRHALAWSIFIWFTFTKNALSCCFIAFLEHAAIKWIPVYRSML